MQDSAPRCPSCHSPIPPDAPGGICPACALLGVAGTTDPQQAADAHMPMLDEVAAAFPELDLLELIGQGGMGIVFKARQPRIERFVALKILPPALAAQPGFSTRFTREARALAKLAHPHIVAVYDFGERAGFYYLLMEFVNGVNLRQAMRAGVTPEQALLLVPRVCEALQFAHDHGVLHRDIKPENILLDTAGTPKLADFGIAKLADESPAVTGLTQTGAQLGTAAYMAPEQIEKPATVDHRADIYSLGVVLYEMLTGELPLGRFAAPSAKAHVGQGVDDVVLRALEKERERRQQSATEMKTQVEGAAHAPLPRTAKTPQTSSAARWARIALGAFCAFILLCWAWLGLGQSFPALAEMLPFFVVLTAVFAAVAALFARVHREPPAPSRVQVNLWPHRLWWLIVGMIVLPLVTAFSGLIVPRLTLLGNDAGAPGGLLIAVFGLLPFATGAALWFAYHRTRTLTPPPGPPAPWNPWPKRIFLLLVVLVVLPVVLFAIALAVPALMYQRLRVPPPAAAEHAAFLAAPPQALVTAERPPFIGELTQGSVELVAVSPHPAGDARGWRMNGEPAIEGPFINRGAKTHANANERAYEFVFRTRDLPPGASTLAWHIENSSSAWGGNPELAAEPGKPLADCFVIAATHPRDQRTLDLRAGAAIGPWSTLLEAAPGNSIATSSSHAGLSWNIIQGTTVESKAGAVIVTYTHARRKGWHERVVAVTTDGNEVTASFSSLLNEQSEWRFDNLPLESIAHFRFQVRPVQWVLFRGVPLAPAESRGIVPGEAIEKATLHEEEIRLRREQHEAMKQRFAAGIAAHLDVAASERDLAIAEARGDAVRIAKAKVRYAEGKLDFVKKQNVAGVIEAAEVRSAELELNAARKDETAAMGAMRR